MWAEVQTKEGYEAKDVRPGKWLVDAIYERGNFNGQVKPLAGVIHSPTIRSDGSILQSVGYDEETGLIYRSTIQFPAIPDSPTKEEALQAFKMLSDVVRDFPMLESADISAWVSMVLSMVGRACVSGCTPLFSIDANTRGAGKSLLVDAASIIGYGMPAARRPFTSQDDEMRKSITAIALEAVQSVLFDNLNVILCGASLDAALTSEYWTDRILNTSTTTGRLPMRVIWCATGNNIAYGSDIARRVLPIRLQTSLESPEDRTGFVNPDLLAWVRENRPHLAVAALTILRAYFVAGCPMQTGGIWGSFEAWARIIRGALVWCGATDPMLTRKAATENDVSKNILGLLIVGLQEADPDRKGLTVKEIERLTTHRVDEQPLFPTLVEAVSEICGSKFSQRFAATLRSFKGRSFRGKKIEGITAHGGVKRWTVIEFGGGDGGDGCHDLTQLNAMSNSIPSLNTPNSKCLTHRVNLETSPPSQPSSPRCPNCGGAIIVGPDVNGWVNHECSNCSFIKPIQLADVEP